MKATIQSETLEFEGKVTTQGSTRMIMIPRKHHTQIEPYTQDGVKVKVNVSNKDKAVTLEFTAKVAKKGEKERIIIIPAAYHDKVEYFTKDNIPTPTIQLSLAVAKW